MLDGVGTEVHGVLPDRLMNDVLGGGEIQDHHPFLFLFTVIRDDLPQSKQGSINRDGVILRQACFILATIKKQDSPH